MKVFLITLSVLIHLKCYALPLLEKGVENAIYNVTNKHTYQSFIYFFNTNRERDIFIKKWKSKSEVKIHSLNFMPAAILTLEPKAPINFNLISDKNILYIALNKPAGEKELTSNLQHFNEIQHLGQSEWWKHGYTGQNTVVGLIDSGIAPDHPALQNKKIIINKTSSAHYHDYPYGVRTAHGTGVACIYAGYQIIKNQAHRGVAFESPIIMSTLAGEGNKRDHDFWLTYSSLNWLLGANTKPTVINYSFGNGKITCPHCNDWSGMAMVVDYIVNKYHILWVTSAGNKGEAAHKKNRPYNSTMTVPADNYNGLTVTNMDIYHKGPNGLFSNKRETHKIYHSSSRGPTLKGRKKPDISAPGNNTLTCAPDPQKYNIKYTARMQYKEGYRLMGGTSSAAPHVGAAALLLHSAHITHPMLIKALLINSADSWVSNDKFGSNDSYHEFTGGHHESSGSEWNSTYGWGYMNLYTAYRQKDFLNLNQLSKQYPIIEYKVKLNDFDKVTLVHERRLGFTPKGQHWQLSHLTLEIFDVVHHSKLASDSSPIDTVHQVSLKTSRDKEFYDPLQRKEFIVRVRLKPDTLEGSNVEPFAIAFPTSIISIKKYSKLSAITGT
ncbi:subtilisin-like serine protease [Legionella wadsworthii]|uniref:Subtilisin-like serine protease n=1 Tax=Legionella wadsworthii TaxID=28088 RepID=A0A378LPD1_9GAMM|nr:S8 family serine peptidase [Legionella wadsworthii]STY28623.1 subtilisin-like serine protease [Legionella wadsworthii]